MKKIVFIICTVVLTISATAYGFINWEEPTQEQETSINSKTEGYTLDIPDLFDIKNEVKFYYGVDSRFINTVTKEKLIAAKSIIDILPEYAAMDLQTFSNVKINILSGDAERAVVGANEFLSEAQIELLQSSDYTTNFYITADCMRKASNGELQRYELVYYMSVIPENSAQYKTGKRTLIDYLKQNSLKETSTVVEGKLQPGKVRFVITKEGEIVNVRLESTSGYTKVDKKMIKLLRGISSNWDPATNSNGDSVDQELVFSFGVVGC